MTAPRLHVVREGEGPFVVLSHALGSDLRMWDGVAALLARAHTVLRYDHRNHGGSERVAEPFGMQALARDAAALIERETGGEPVHFVGLSMGGMIAQQLGIRHPQAVRSLSLCDTASEMPPRAMWETRFATARAEGMAGMVDGTIQRWFVPSFPTRAPDVIEQVRAMILSIDVEGYIACGSAVRDMSQTHLLKQITTPTLILLGRDDPACTLAASEVLHREIAGAEIHVIDDAAHLSNLEHPDQFNRVLRDFIDRH